VKPRTIKLKRSGIRVKIPAELHQKLPIKESKSFAADIASGRSERVTGALLRAARAHSRGNRPILAGKALELAALVRLDGGKLREGAKYYRRAIGTYEAERVRRINARQHYEDVQHHIDRIWGFVNQWEARVDPPRPDPSISSERSRGARTVQDRLRFRRRLIGSLPRHPAEIAEEMRLGRRRVNRADWRLQFPTRQSIFGPVIDGAPREGLENIAKGRALNDDFLMALGCRRIAEHHVAKGAYYQGAHAYELEGRVYRYLKEDPPPIGEAYANAAATLSTYIRHNKGRMSERRIRELKEKLDDWRIHSKLWRANS